MRIPQLLMRWSLRIALTWALLLAPHLPPQVAPIAAAQTPSAQERRAIAERLSVRLRVVDASGSVALDEDDVPRIARIMENYASLGAQLADATLVHLAERDDLRVVGGDLAVAVEVERLIRGCQLDRHPQCAHRDEGVFAPGRFTARRGRSSDDRH